MATPKKVLFVCHSYWDREAVRIFLDCVFGKGGAGRRREFLSKKWRIRFTSATSNLEEEPLEPGVRIWPRVRAEIAKTSCFIACLSDNFVLDSFYCIPELTLYEERRYKRKGLPLIPLLVCPLGVSHEKSPVTAGQTCRALNSKDDIEKVFSRLRSKGVLVKSSTEPDRVADLVTKADAHYLNVEMGAKGASVNLAFRHFASPTSGGPVTFIVERSEYEQVSIRLAEQARSQLLWTLFKSPLLVADAYTQPGHLMPYDEDFRSFKKRAKLRLVIFLDARMARAYDNLNLSYHNRRLKRLVKVGRPFVPLTRAQLEGRKRAFEESSQERGRLYFTTLEKLPDCLPGNLVTTFNEESYLEFVFANFGEQGKDHILMEAGFNSEFALKNRLSRSAKYDTLCRHVTFYKTPSRLCSDAIEREVPTYRALYGHLEMLKLIGEALFAKNPPNSKVFVGPNQIAKLYEP